MINDLEFANVSNGPEEINGMVPIGLTDLPDGGRGLRATFERAVVSAVCPGNGSIAEPA